MPALPEGTDAARLQTGRALEHPSPGVRSTWEGQRAEALLELEQQLQQLEQKVRLQAAHGSTSPKKAVPEDKENQYPASMGVKNTLRPSTLDHPSKFYPEQQTEPMPPHAPLQIGQPQPPKLAPPWEIGGVLGPWEYRKGCRGLTALLSQCLALQALDQYRHLLLRNSAHAVFAAHRCCTWDVGGRTWDVVALLALEQERNALANQLEAYARVDLVHAQKMREVHEKHAEAVKDASVSGLRGTQEGKMPEVGTIRAMRCMRSMQKL
eukprot:scaffold250430_cov21-Tisochrysis_lutea.AAC.2